VAFYTKRTFKAVNRKIDGKTTVVYKEGANGTGITLPFACGFCADQKTGLANAAFRTRRERNRHANYCPDPMPRN
jgi:hypothetical protein